MPVDHAWVAGEPGGVLRKGAFGFEIRDERLDPPGGMKLNLGADSPDLGRPPRLQAQPPVQCDDRDPGGAIRRHHLIVLRAMREDQDVGLLQPIL